MMAKASTTTIISDIHWREPARRPVSRSLAMNPGVDAESVMPAGWPTLIVATYRMRWRVRPQRVSSKKWISVCVMKLTRSPMLVLYSWFSGVMKDQ